VTGLPTAAILTEGRFCAAAVPAHAAAAIDPADSALIMPWRMVPFGL
jgi:hypothetical protein